MVVNRRSLLKRLTVLGGLAMLAPAHVMLGGAGVPTASAGSIPKYKTISGTLLDDMSGFAKSAGTGTLTYSSSAPMWPDGTTGGMLWDQNTDGGALVGTRTLGAPVDLSRSSNITISFSTPSGFSALGLHLCSGGSIANRYSYTISPTTIEFSENVTTVTIDRSVFTPTGAPNWAAINFIQIQVDSLGGQQNDAYIKGIFYNTYSRPAVVLFFDDLNSTDFTNAYPVLSGLNLKANIAFQSDRLNLVNYLTTAQCQTLYNAGWDFCNHTHTHAVLTSLTAQQIQDELNACQNVLTANGWTRGNNVVVYPQGATNSLVDSVVARQFKYGRGGRTAKTNFQQSPFGGIDSPIRLVTAQTLNNTNFTLSQANALVDDCIRLGTSLFCFCHLVDNSATGASWELTNRFVPFVQRLARLDAGNVLDVMTISQWDQSLSGRVLR